MKETINPHWGRYRKLTEKDLTIQLVNPVTDMTDRFDVRNNTKMIVKFEEKIKKEFEANATIRITLNNKSALWRKDILSLKIDDININESYKEALPDRPEKNLQTEAVISLGSECLGRFRGNEGGIIKDQSDMKDMLQFKWASPEVDTVTPEYIRTEVSDSDGTDPSIIYIHPSIKKYEPTIDRFTNEPRFQCLYLPNAFRVIGIRHITYAVVQGEIIAHEKPELEDSEGYQYQKWLYWFYAWNSPYPWEGQKLQVQDLKQAYEWIDETISKIIAKVINKEKKIRDNNIKDLFDLRREEWQ